MDKIAGLPTETYSWTDGYQYSLSNDGMLASSSGFVCGQAIPSPIWRQMTRLAAEGKKLMERERELYSAFDAMHTRATRAEAEIATRKCQQDEAALTLRQALEENGRLAESLRVLKAASDAADRQLAIYESETEARIAELEAENKKLLTALDGMAKILASLEPVG